MLLVSFDDMVEKRARYDDLGTNVRVMTNATLYTALAYLIAIGVVSVPALGQLALLGCVNRATKWTVKKICRRGKLKPLPLNLN